MSLSTYIKHCLTQTCLLLSSSCPSLVKDVSFYLHPVHPYLRDAIFHHLQTSQRPLSNSEQRSRQERQQAQQPRDLLLRQLLGSSSLFTNWDRSGGTAGFPPIKDDSYYFRTPSLPRNVHPIFSFFVLSSKFVLRPNFRSLRSSSQFQSLPPNFKLFLRPFEFQSPSQFHSSSVRPSFSSSSQFQSLCPSIPISLFVSISVCP